MRVALLISGYLRSLNLNLECIQEKILSKFDSVDVFLHLTKDEHTKDKYYNDIQQKDIDKIKSVLNPLVTLEESTVYFYSDKKQNDVFNACFKYYKLNKIKKEYESLFGKYDLVIKYRPDLNLSSDLVITNKSVITIPEESKVDRSKLKDPSDPNLCDIFAYGPSEVMDRYFDIYVNLHTLMKKYGTAPETLLFYHLNDSGVPYQKENINYGVILSSCNLFAICGDSGSGKSTLGKLLKTFFSNSFLLECDRYHKWERNDKNWSEYTHLNPEANFIAKMKNDIFDLKVGKSIYHVDYDHNSGKFTDQRQIDSSDNIIVCGLHSLYKPDKDVYNLSIFMDPDINLKQDWKIKRDCEKRGYTKEQIIKQIESRRNDYETYIEPQKENSDVIVNFFQESDLCLRVLINKKFNISPILDAFLKHNILFNYQTTNNRHEFIFKYYTDSQLWNFNIDVPHKYYYYILFLILNLKQ